MLTRAKAQCHDAMMKTAARIVSILTSPKIHLATFIVKKQVILGLKENPGPEERRNLEVQKLSPN